MKDIIITGRRVRTELITLLVCFVIAFGLNVYAIATYDGKWSELFWSLGFVVAAAGVLYVVWGVVRLLFCALKKLFIKSKPTK